MVFDLCKGYCSGAPGFFSASFIAPLLAPQPERLFFTANPGVEGRELWTVDRYISFVSFVSFVGTRPHRRH